MNVNPEVISWALTWNNLEPKDVRVSFPLIDAWLAGTKQPIFKQLENFTERVHVPIFEFWRNELQTIELQNRDFRSKDVQNIFKQPSPELLETIDEMLLRQEYMRRLFIEQGHGACELAGLCAHEKKMSTTDVAKKLVDALHLLEAWQDEQEKQQMKHWEYFTVL